MLELSLTINSKNLWMAHFCHLLFPDYAQALPIVQPTESTAAFAGFPNCPENLLQPVEGTFIRFWQSSLKPVFFSSCKNDITKSKLWLSAILPCLSQYLFRRNITPKKIILRKTLLDARTTQLKHRIWASPIREEAGEMQCCATAAPNIFL